MSLDGEIARVVRDSVGDVVRQIVRDEVRAALADHGGSTGGYMTVAQAAELAAVHEQTIREWIRAGKLPALSAGRHIRIRPADLEAAMQPRAPEGAIDFAARARELRAR